MCARASRSLHRLTYTVSSLAPDRHLLSDVSLFLLCHSGYCYNQAGRPLSLSIRIYYAGAVPVGCAGTTIQYKLNNTK